MGSLKFPVTGQKVFESSSLQRHPLGARGEDRFGRTFRYALADAVALVVANAIQSQAQITQHQDMTPAAAAIGDKSVTATPGATAGAANLYAGGMAIISVTPGLGYAYPIKAHPAITASVAFAFQLEDGWEVQVALTAANSKVTLAPNPHRNVIQAPANTLTGICVGVCPFVIAASEYGWLGTGGVHGALIQGTPSVGELVSAPGSAAGSLNDYAAGNEQAVGVMMDTGEDGKVSPVKLFID